MKAEQIITQIRNWLPFFTDLFSNNIQVASLSRSATTVTAVTVNPHGLNTGDVVTITNALSPVDVDSSSVVDGIVIVETVTRHDFTSDIDGQEVRITGPGYDETFELSFVPNRTSLELIDDGQPPIPAGSTVLEADLVSYNGTRPVVVIDPTTFTFETQNEAGSPAQGDIIASAQHRISGCVDARVLQESYTAQNFGDDLWAFVVLRDPDANKDRINNNDAVTTLQQNSDFRHEMIENFSVYVVIPNKGNDATDAGGRKARDVVEDVRVPLFKTLLGWMPEADDEQLSCPGQNAVVWNGDGGFVYEKAYYIHEFRFQRVTDITSSDTWLDNDFSVAFRDIDLYQCKDHGFTTFDSMINLDEFPEGSGGGGSACPILTIPEVLAKVPDQVENSYPVVDSASTTGCDGYLYELNTPFSSGLMEVFLTNITGELSASLYSPDGTIISDQNFGSSDLNLEHDGSGDFVWYLVITGAESVDSTSWDIEIVFTSN